MRPSRVIYVENDPALRGIMTRALSSSPDVELTLSTGDAVEALGSAKVQQADVALLDLALGADQLNGIDLGLALREINPDLGIVIYSQHSLKNLARRVPENQRMGWSFIPKSGEMEVAELIEILRATARGIALMSEEVRQGDDAGDLLEALAPRQRAVMALAATGLSAPDIAQRLGLTQDSVRKDLSKAYRVLVPGDEGGDLRTRAVLAYLRIMRDQAWDDTR
ncbi:MAG: response regulator [Candidatus Nanopelagicales bacterium]